MNNKEAINIYKDSGRIVFIYPRLKQISLNGGSREPIKEGLKKIRECILREGLK